MVKYILIINEKYSIDFFVKECADIYRGLLGGYIVERIRSD